MVSHASALTGDDMLKKFWELEEKPTSFSALTPEERSVVQHFRDNHTRGSSGRFIVPLPRKPDAVLRQSVDFSHLSAQRTLQGI